MTLTCFAIIPHPIELKALLVPQETGWSLPCYRMEGKLDSLHIFNQSFKDQFGLDVIVLRNAGPPHTTPGGDQVEFYIMENRSPGWLPPGARWAGKKDLDALPLMQPLQTRALLDWFDEDQSEAVSDLRSPWANSGWLDEAVDWIAEQLRYQGIQAVGFIEQIRSWSISSMLRIQTSQGYVYFKASHPMFPHEARLTQFLSARYPLHVPRVIAADGDRNWLLMAGFQGAALGDVDDPMRWEEALRLFAQIQIESIDRINDLLALGCPDRRIHHLPSQMAELLADEAAMMVDPNYQLSESQIQALRDLQPQLERTVETLAEYDLPAALLHGDLHPYNIVITEAGVLFYDWSDGAIAPPFFELLTTFERMGSLAEKLEDQAAFRRVYLEPWTAYAPIDRLEAAFDLSQKLLPLYHAISYRWIVHHTEPKAKWELGGGVGFFLKKLLRAFGKEDSV